MTHKRSILSVRRWLLMAAAPVILVAHVSDARAIALGLFLRGSEGQDGKRDHCRLGRTH